ncbi:MAG: CNNM domain-containing protein, partial [Actinomycetota bacterium]|nr:CNNM domain-containing protein [Actinomycetota bacterium]
MLVLVLISLNAVFVAGEFSLVAVDTSRIDVMAGEGNTAARLVRGLLRRLSFHLAGAQLGITVTSLLLGVIAEDALGPIVTIIPGIDSGTGAVAAVVAIVVATVVQMVFGEQAPKNLAVTRPLGVSLTLAPILRLYGVVAAPITLLFNGLANRTVRLLGTEPTEELRVVRSLDDLEYVVVSSSDNTIAEADARLLQRTLRLSRKDAADALTPRTAMVTLDRAGTVGDLVVKAMETGHSRFPVLGGDIDDIAGVVEVRDVFHLEPDRRVATPIAEVLRPAVVVPEQRELDGVLLDLEANDSRLAVV